MYKNILVPLDVGHIPEGKTGIDVAVGLAESDGRIFLLNVVEEIPSWAAVELPRGIIEKSVDKAQENLQAIANASSLKMDVEVRAGHAYQTILDVADEKSVDLIVITSHRPGLQDYFLGSTAAKVVRHAKCSVHVIR